MNKHAYPSPTVYRRPEHNVRVDAMRRDAERPRVDSVRRPVERPHQQHRTRTPPAPSRRTEPYESKRPATNGHAGAALDTLLARLTALERALAETTATQNLMQSRVTGVEKEQASLLRRISDVETEQFEATVNRPFK